VSATKNAINSTFRRILSYTAEIIMSIILLVIICIPLIFTIPMWFQHILTDTPRNELSINLVAWFGYDGTLWLTLLIGLISFSIGYVYIMKMKPGVTPTTEEKGAEKMPELSEEEEEEILAAEDIEEEEIAAEDQEDVEEPDFEDIEEALEDIENDEEESESEV
jgi:hypothetical protein